MRKTWNTIAKLKYNDIRYIIEIWNQFMYSLECTTGFIYDIYDAITEGVLQDVSLKDVYDNIYYDDFGDPDFDLQDTYFWWDDDWMYHSCSPTTIADIPIICDNLDDFIEFILNDKDYIEELGLDS